MLKKIWPLILVSVMTMVLTTVFQPLSLIRAIAQSREARVQPTDISTCQSFPATGFQVCGRFLSYWYKYGGLPVFGYPISNPFRETSGTDGKEYTVQYFERAVFELHPGNRPPYDVLLSQVGREKYQRQYPHGTSGNELIGDPQPELNVGKQLRPGIYATLIREEQAAITGLDTGVCGLELTWVLQVENRSNTPFVAALDTGNVVMLDSTGKRFATANKCMGNASAVYSGSFGEAARLAPGETLRGTITFPVEDIPMNASYFQLKLSFSGLPVEFRYLLP